MKNSRLKENNLNRRLIFLKRNFLKTLSLIITLALVFSILPLNAIAADDWNGTGISDDPFLIETADDLALLATNVNSWSGGGAPYDGVFFKVTDDLDLSDYPSWTPIGTQMQRFSGTFDGGNYEITNLSINSPASSYQGLFGSIGGNGTVKNLYISNSSVTGQQFVGSIVAYNLGTIDNCHNNGCAVTSTGADGSSLGYPGENYDISGGIVGFNNGTVMNCHNSSDIKGASQAVGGIIGINNYVTENCFNTGDVLASTDGGISYSGGKVGGIVGMQLAGEIKNCYNTGTIEGSAGIGGIAGTVQSAATITYCYNMGTIKSDSNTGGIVGFVQAYAPIVTHCYNAGDLYANVAAIGGIAGYVDGSAFDLSNSSWVVDKLHVLDGGTILDANKRLIGNIIGASLKYTVAELTDGFTSAANLDADGSGSFIFRPSPSGVGCFGSGTYYPELAVFVNSTDPIVREASLLSVMVSPASTSCTHAPGETFFFDGDGSSADPFLIYSPEQLSHIRQHLGSGLYFEIQNDLDLSDFDNWSPIGDDTTEDNTTRFSGNLIGGGYKISNLTIDHASGIPVGLFGYIGTSGTVDSICVSGNVRGQNNVGAIAGQSNGAITNCCNMADVTANANVGGIVGTSRGTISNCHNTGNISAVLGNANHAGGIAGRSIVTSSITNSYNTGDVSGSEMVGGITGYSQSGEVSFCYNTGTISGIATPSYSVSAMIGGIVGHTMQNITSCLNTGDVSGDSEVGSIVGRITGTPTLSGNIRYEFAKVNGTAIGSTDSGNALDGVHGLSKTASELWTESTYSAWDIGGAWEWDAANTFPKLANIPHPCESQPYPFGFYFDAIPTFLADAMGQLQVEVIPWAGLDASSSRWAADETTTAPASGSFTALAANRMVNMLSGENYLHLTGTWNGQPVTGMFGLYRVSGRYRAIPTPLYRGWTNIPYDVSLRVIAYGGGTPDPLPDLQYSFDPAGPWTDYDYNNPIQIDTTGVYRIYWKEKGNPNNTPLVAEGGNYRFDDIDPDILTIGATTISSSRIYLSATAQDADSGVASYLWEVKSGGGWITLSQTANFRHILLLPDTEYTYRLTVTDFAGNTVSQEISATTDPTNGIPNMYPIIINYTDDGVIVGTETKPFHDGTVLTEANLTIPAGYELVNPNFSYTVSAPATIIVPVKKTSVGPDPVGEKIYAHGYPDELFRPDAPITRAEVTKMLYNLLASGNISDLSYLDDFTDMDDPHWANPALAWAIEHDYLRGYPDGTLRPDAQITRAELSTLMYRVGLSNNLLDNSDVDTPQFPDVDPHWANGAIMLLAQKGIIAGYPDGTFRPDDLITRAETVTICSRLFKRSNNYLTNITFADVTTGHWAYVAIMNAANGS